MTPRAAHLVATWLLAAIAIGCTSKQDASPSSGAPESAVSEAIVRSSLRAVPLPDLSSATAATAEQLREQHSRLSRKIADSTTPVAELAIAYGETGTLLMAAEYRDAAEAALLDAQALAPREMRWPYYLGHLYRLRGDTSRSSAAFERAMQLKSDDAPALVWRGRAYLDEGRPDEAEPIFRQALSIDAGSGAALFGLGRAALARRDFAAAAGYLEQALSRHPHASIVHYSLAAAYRGLGQSDQADAHLRAKGDVDVPLSDPLMDELNGLLHSEFAYEHLGVRALNDGAFEAAARFFRKAIELAPNDPSFRHRLGTTLALQGDTRGAVAEFREVLRRSPDFPSTHYTLGVLLESSGRYREAIEQFAAAIQISPTYLEARLQLAESLRRSGRAPESLPHYAQVAALDPRLPEPLLGYTMALVSLHRYAEARDRLVRDMAVYADRPAFAHALVRVQAAAPDNRVRDGSRAVALAETLISKEQPNADLAEAHAMALAETGRYDEAVTWQRDAILIAERTGQADLSRRMAENLKLFQNRRPSRTPWRTEDPVGLPPAASALSAAAASDPPAR